MDSAPITFLIVYGFFDDDHGLGSTFKAQIQQFH